MDYYSFFVGFFIGFLVLHAIYYLWDLGQVALFLKEAETGALLMLAMSTESIAFLQSVKYETMKTFDVDENTLKTTKNIDDYNFESWKTSAIRRLLTAYPTRFRHLPKYVDWTTAMRILDEIYEKGQRSENAKE